MIETKEYRALKKYLESDDPQQISWNLDNRRLEVLTDRIIYLRESATWRRLEAAYLAKGGKVVTENDPEFDESNWELRS